MSYVSQREVGIHSNNGWSTRDVAIFPFLREEHLPAGYSKYTGRYSKVWNEKTY